MKAMRLRRGTSAERLLITPQEGELIYTTDTKTVYVGDGVTLGGVNFDSGAITVSDINDITIDDLLNDHILVWNSSNSQWENQPRSVSLNNLNDVVYSDPPADRLPLIYDSTLFQWRPGTSEDGSLIRDLSDVSDVSYGSGPTDGQRLVWNNSASRWESTNLYDQSLNTANTVSFAEVRGNFVGSVFADDSTPIVDAINAAVTGKVQLTGPVPSSNTATGSVGEIRFDENYVYVCTATNTWKRATMSDFTEFLPTDYTVSRISGTAPMMVHFSADFIGDATGFHEYNYSWDFDDPTSGTWGTTGKSRNTAKGPVTGHVFETAGTYAVTLTVRGFFGNVVASQTFNITVADPNVTFAGTNTVCVNPAGDTDFTGAPFGCVQLSTNDISVVTPYAVAGTRILFKRGASWTLSAAPSWPDNAGPVHIGAYGSGTQDASGRYTNAPEFSLVGGNGFVALGNRKNWVWMDLSFVGDGNGGVFRESGPHSDILLFRLAADNFNLPFAWGSGVPRSDQPIQNMAIIDSKAVNSVLNGVFIQSEYLAFMGNEIADIEESHVVRIGHAYRSIISHNKLSGASIVSGTGRLALKLHSPRDEVIEDPANQYELTRTEFTIVSDNIVGSSPPWPIVIGPQNTGAAERLSNIIVERNLYTVSFGQYYSPNVEGPIQAIRFTGTDSTIRNNVVDLTGRGHQVEAINIVALVGLVETDNIRVYNNTVYKNDSIFFNSVGSSYRNGIKVGSGVTNSKVFNNLFITQDGAGAELALSDDGTNTESGTNVLTYDTSILVDPDNVDPFARNYSLLPTASALIDQGTLVESVFEDFNEISRSSTLPFEIGAFGFLPSSTGTFAVNVNYPSTLVNTPYSDNVLNNDEGDTLSVSSWGTPTNGTLTSTNSNGSFTYTPNTDFIGNDSFSYELTDGTLTSTGLVFIVVADVDDERPTVVSSTPNQTYTVGVEITPLDLSAAYSDDTGIELVTVVFNPLPNGLTINTSTGVVTGTPSVGSEGTYNMRIWAYNINGLWTEDNFTITVNAA